MSSNTHEARELLRLFKCVVDTGTDVLAAFAKVSFYRHSTEILNNFLMTKNMKYCTSGNLKSYYVVSAHQPVCNVTRKRCMDNWIFKTFYDDSGPENTGHIVRNSRDIVQVCLHKYITRNIAIEELDISTITFLLRNLAILSLNETTSLNIITKTRNQICHAYSMNCYTMASMHTAWSDLENALVDLTDPPYKRILRKQVKFLRKAELEKEEITELKNNVDRVLLEVKTSSDNNVGYLIGMETRLENKSINNTEDIKQHTTEETSYFAAQAQQALSENIQNTEQKLLQKVQSSSNDNVLYLVGMENRLENKLINNTEDIKQHTTEETSYFATQMQQTLSEKIQYTGDILQKRLEPNCMKTFQR
ncbi:unnamed protein product [Mytilus edulis]|uniref:DZIP3-like HEPN domain-containing protein n=1 Tax=Mytilus edulis TaxID=6550 RepID=A0A8S3TAI0_MYTED|nr:unnamed protein product [Mytilus edulis]